MISEVEKIMQSGELVGTVNDVNTKAMGVTTANLMPDEKGEVPLSKQSAFQIESVMTSVQPQEMEKVDLNPQPVQAETTMPEALTQNVEPTPVPASVTPEVSAQPVAPSVPVEPVTPTVNDTISENPVDVVAPAELGGLDFTSVIPDIPLVTDEVKPAAAEEKPAAPSIDLPAMPDKILAEEPKEVNNDLFVGGTDNVFEETQPVQTNNMNTTIAEMPTMDGLSQTVSTPLVETQSQVQPENVTLEVEAPKVEVPLETLDTTTVQPVESTTPVVEDTQVKDVVPETIPAEPTVEMPKTSLFENPEVVMSTTEAEETPALETTSKESIETQTSVLPEKSDEEEKKKDYINEEKLDSILEKLNQIDESLKSIDSKMNLKETVVQELPKIDGIQTQEQNSTNEMSIPTMESIPTPEVKETPTVQEEMVDALGQINGMETVPAVDEAPIIGGRFI